ncbi:acyl-coenzyme A thioesterase 2, mitochondrial-like isoform X3 [Diceros bicornis minor]|uniref:acyl-coenzyme A thioesterase 2, mitochondrial-like isoform X3 n=1 Tax=Diceros bicornis minor TaxID=77932 RepID=UPI0026F3288C|nr:acyl-coenzyme A thioesterase 2, mitochondrial-like isoform X3 [Diceros bicornis minor]
MQPAARCSLTSFELSPQPVQLNRGLKSRRKMASPAVLRAAGLGQWGLKSWARWPVSRIHARMAATVILEPAGRCRWDEPVRIAVRGLAPEQPVTLRASLRDEKGALFRAHARYCADAEGQVDLERAPALGGSFAGLEPMGLLWALEPEKPLLRLVKRDVQTPFAVELEVLDGHDEPECGRLLGRAVHERDFLGPGVRREPVRAGRVRATLFLPPEPGPFPGIVDISGAGGGLLEYRASLLAGKGFAVMALAYYNCEDLPKSVETLHLEYFEEAVNYLLSHPQVRMTTTGRVNSMPLRPLNAYRPMVRRSPGSSVTRGRGTTLSLLTSPCAQLPCTPWWAVLSSGEGSPGLMPWPRWMPGNSSRLSSTNTWVVRSWGDSLENQLQ